MTITPDNPPAQQFDFKAELAAILRLGWPIVLTQLFIMLNGTVDAAMAGRYSATDLAGVSLGGMFLWPTFMLLTGLTMALTPIVAQLRGAKREQDIGHQIRQGLWLCVATASILVLVLNNVADLYDYVGTDPTAARIAQEYLSAAAWGAPPIIFYVALRHICEGLGKPHPPMWIAGGIIPLNALLNYGFIYGKFGLPELGGVGCGYATAIVFWLQLMLMLGVCRMQFFRAVNAFACFEPPRWSTIRSIIIIGLPIGLTIFVEMAVFSVVGLLIAQLGVIAVAANSIAGNLNWATYVIPSALGHAASSRVGFHVCAENCLAARSTSAVVFRFTLGYAVVMSILLLVFRYPLIGIFTTDSEVIALTANLVIIIAIYQLVDDSNAVTIGALRGYKDTRVPMYAGLIGYWFFALPVGYALAEGLLWPGLAPGVYGYWVAMAAGIGLVACTMGLRLWVISGNETRIRDLAEV